MEEKKLNSEEMKISPEPAPAPEGDAGAGTGKDKKPLGKLFLKALCLLLETVLILVIALYGVLLVIMKGPSEAASRLFVRSVRETSAIGFLADFFFSEDEISAILSGSEEMVFQETNTDLINLGSTTAGEADQWGLTDEDGDGIIIDPVKGAGYSGYMMVVLDPTRVIVGTDPDRYGSTGYTVEGFVKKFDAVAGVNGGAFMDINGMGDGSQPDGLVIFQGQTYNYGIKQGFAGIDKNGILHVGCKDKAEAVKAEIQYGASYGPVLLQNGEMTDLATLESGVNPRTAVGQRSDGAMLLLVIDGRQVTSLGATYLDEAEVMLRYGAVNAINMDGGSSSMMWYEDGYVNNCASVVGIRDIPTAFVVLKQK